MSHSSVLGCIGQTPLVQLARVGARGRTILGKCEHLNPGGSVKDRIALAIVDAAEHAGRLSPGGTLVEATAGNTGVGLALVAATMAIIHFLPKLTKAVPSSLAAILVVTGLSWGINRASFDQLQVAGSKNGVLTVEDMLMSNLKAQEVAKAREAKG